MRKGLRRHPFRFKVQNVPGEKPRIFESFAVVKYAERPVTLTLTPDDVKQSIAAKGVGNTQTCSMAMCAKRQASAFPHPLEGFIDWQYTRAYIVTKLDKTTGLPIECVAYDHHDEIAKINDSKGGQKKLLADLQANGPRTIQLLPIKHQKPRPGRPRGKNDGSRTKHIPGVGAKLRWAIAQLGGVPQ